MNAFEDPQNWEEIRLVDIVDPKRRRREEQKEEYRFPSGLRHFQNIIEVLEPGHQEMVLRRASLLKDLEAERVKIEFMENEFRALGERMNSVEGRLREAYRKINEQRQHL